jgi:hypothetical protein
VQNKIPSWGNSAFNLVLEHSFAHPKEKISVG